MWRKLILISIIIGLVIGAFYMASIAPYHIYTLTLTEGVNTRFLKMSPTPAVYYDGHMAAYEADDEIISKSKSIYANLHMKNFDMVLPINHPAISFIPTIKVESNKVKLGAAFLDSHFRNQFSFVIEHEKKFETNLVNQEIYFLPFFRSYIDKKDSNDIWHDIFSKKLSLPSNEGKSFFESLKILNQYSYQELVYNLFILTNRLNFLPEQIQDIQFNSENNVGMVVVSKNENELIEKLYILNQGFIYPITIKTNLNSELGKYSRKRFIKELNFHQSSKDSAISIYAYYKNFDYQDRISDKGMIYLFSAWSHDLENKDYVRVIITFLERGTSNIKYLKSFYEYAFKQFGSSFSTSRDFLIETPEEKLKRSMKEELEKEIEKEALKRSNSIDDKSTAEEKIKNNLNKAKEQNQKKDTKPTQIEIE